MASGVGGGGVTASGKSCKFDGLGQPLPSVSSGSVPWCLPWTMGQELPTLIHSLLWAGSLGCWGALSEAAFPVSNRDRAVMITMATTHSFNKYVSSSYSVPGTAADTNDLMETRQPRALIMYGVYILVGGGPAE